MKSKHFSSVAGLVLHILILICSVLNAINGDEKAIVIIWTVSAAIWFIAIIVDILSIIKSRDEQ